MDIQGSQERLKNRDAFTRQELRMGMPAGIFMVGVLLLVGSFAIFKMFLAPLLIGSVYFPFMFRIHKNDSRGFKVWMACFADKTDSWQAGTVSKTEILLIDRVE